ncbi:hypothetical protein, partial [Burkholderia pseudomallei]|uniref:hypothetical protein n=1 Tax=Burkholderia pseudomallei TaxID=28450 RepID=UPI001C4A7E71
MLPHSPPPRGETHGVRVSAECLRPVAARLVAARREGGRRVPVCRRPAARDAVSRAKRPRNAIVVRRERGAGMTAGSLPRDVAAARGGVSAADAMRRAGCRRRFAS